MEDRPKVGIATIVTKDKKILVGKRKSGHGKGTSCLPGGHLEFNESIEDCARRETKEETGIDIKNIRFAAVTNDIFKKERKHYITIFMLAEYKSGNLEVKEPGKHKGWQWLEWNELSRPLFLPLKNLLKQNYNPFNSRKY